MTNVIIKSPKAHREQLLHVQNDSGPCLRTYANIPSQTTLLTAATILVKGIEESGGMLQKPCKRHICFWAIAIYHQGTSARFQLLDKHRMVHDLLL